MREVEGEESPSPQKTPDDPPEEIKVPRVHMDYFFMSKEDDSASKNPDAGDGGRKVRSEVCEVSWKERPRNGRRDGLANLGH